MIGRAPMMSQPVYQQVPVQSYPGQDFASQPMAWPQASPAWQQAPVNATWAPQPPATQPIFRGKGEDEPFDNTTVPASVAPSAPAALVMPSPGELGVAESRGRDGKADWNNARERLQQLGAIAFNLDQLGGEGCRFSCFLPTASPSRTHHIEATAASESEAIRLALAKAEEWAKEGK
jgi:hypothetical protein